MIANIIAILSLIVSIASFVIAYKVWNKSIYPNLTCYIRPINNNHDVDMVMVNTGYLSCEIVDASIDPKSENKTCNLYSQPNVFAYTGHNFLSTFIGCEMIPHHEKSIRINWGDNDPGTVFTATIKFKYGKKKLTHTTQCKFSYNEAVMHHCNITR